MQGDDFVTVYQAKSDEEIMQLAAARDELTSEARLALEGEVTGRRITVAEPFTSSRNDDPRLVRLA